jgi:hypothetical protein
MDEQKLIPRLMSEFDYPYQGAQLVVVKLQNSNQQIQTAFQIWWEGGELPDLTIEEYSVARLMNEHGMNPVAAFLTLDWLMREPEKAKASLRRGHDRVKRSSSTGQND